MRRALNYRSEETLDAYMCARAYGTIVPLGTRRENTCMVFVTILGREPDARILRVELSSRVEVYYSFS